MTGLRRDGPHTLLRAAGRPLSMRPRRFEASIICSTIYANRSDQISSYLAAEGNHFQGAAREPLNVVAALEPGVVAASCSGDDSSASGRWRYA
jgi:hypothetical protein